MEVGGLFFEFEAVRTVSSEYDAPRRYEQYEMSVPSRQRVHERQLYLSYFWERRVSVFRQKEEAVDGLSDVVYPLRDVRDGGRGVVSVDGQGHRTFNILGLRRSDEFHGTNSILSWTKVDRLRPSG